MIKGLKNIESSYRKDFNGVLELILQTFKI